MDIEERFAYPNLRPGQGELARRVYEACRGREVLLAEAASGFGKTAAILAGTLSAAEEAGLKVVFACRTKRQIQRVVEEIARLQRKHDFTAASLLSKFDYCLLRRQRPVPRESFGWYCSFNVSNNLCSYFLNVTLAAADFERTAKKAIHGAMDHQALVRESEAVHVCPYEVAKLAIAQAQVAVAPYQYVFDPRSMHMLFDVNSLDRGKTILVVDEAHNLRDFFRGIHSATLTMDQVAGAVREAEAMLMEEAASSLRGLQTVLEECMARCNGWLLDKASILQRIHDERGAPWLQNLAFELSACSGAAWGAVVYERRLPSLVLQVGGFLAKLSSSEGSALVKWGNAMGLLDPDPVSGFESYLAEFHSSVLVSATISPSSIFKRSLGLGEQVPTYEVDVEPSVEVRTIIDTGTSTRYKLRTPEMISRIAAKVSAVILGTESGVGVFSPSYLMNRAIFDLVSRRMSQRHMVSEAPGLSTQEAADVFDSFRSGRDSVLFGVQGGRFSEGEDFSGDAMGSVVVIGLSLPPPSPMMYAEYSFLKRAGERDSFLMLSRLPALRKAFQAAGRHIRNPGKRGLVFFFDERFKSEAVKELMPSWMKRDLMVGDFPEAAIVELTSEFWGQRDSPPHLS